MPSEYKIEKIVFTFESDGTIVDVWCSATSDGMLGVKGLHKKVFRPEISVLKIMAGPIAKQEYLAW